MVELRATRCVVWVLYVLLGHPGSYMSWCVRPIGSTAFVNVLIHEWSEVTQGMRNYRDYCLAECLNHDSL